MKMTRKSNFILKVGTYLVIQREIGVSNDRQKAIGEKKKNAHTRELRVKANFKIEYPEVHSSLAAYKPDIIKSSHCLNLLDSSRALFRKVEPAPPFTTPD